jgi:L-asparaginase
MKKKPLIALIGTGGTIAGSAPSRTQSARYLPASVGVKTIVEGIPELHENYALSLAEPFRLSSYDISPGHWMHLLEVVGAALADPAVDGAIVTHGTDTLEETAFFLHLSLDTIKPAVIVGAMRPSTAYSADGPANILDAFRVASDSGACGRGCLVVMNGRIHSARDVSKRHVSSVEAFDSGLAGAVGEVSDQQVRWFQRAWRPPVLALDPQGVLPRVDIVASYAGADAIALQACVQAGARGIVHAGLGNGNAPPGVRELLRTLVNEGVALGRCSRWIPGGVTRNSTMFDDDRLGIWTAGGLPPHKLRVAMMVAMAHGLEGSEVQAWLDRVVEPAPAG